MPTTPLEWAALAALVTAVVVIFGTLWLVRRKAHLPEEPKEVEPEVTPPPPPPRRRTRPFHRSYPQIGDGMYQVRVPFPVQYGPEGATNFLRLESGDTFLIWSDTLFVSDRDIQITDWRQLNKATQDGHAVRISNVQEALRAPFQQMQAEMTRMGQEMSRGFRQDFQRMQQDLSTLSRDGQWSVTTSVRSTRTPANPDVKVQEKKAPPKEAPSRYDRIIDDSDDF